MDEGIVIHPGIGRKKHMLKPGKYPIEAFIATAESMLAPATRYFLRVAFKNGSSQALDHVEALKYVSDVAEVAQIFLHATYPDGSTISGRPINSPGRGFLIYDDRATPQTPGPSRMSLRLRTWWRGNDPVAARERARLDGSFAASTLSHQQGEAFLEKWTQLQNKSRFAFNRYVKYTSAVLVGAAFLWFFGVVAILTTVYGIQTPKTEVRAPVLPWGLVILLSTFFCMGTLMFHTERWRKFLATRLYRPRVGPALSKVADSLHALIAGTKQHVAMIVITSLVTVIGGVIVLGIGKWLNL